MRNSWGKKLTSEKNGINDLSMSMEGVGMKAGMQREEADLHGVGCCCKGCFPHTFLTPCSSTPMLLFSFVLVLHCTALCGDCSSWKGLIHNAIFLIVSVFTWFSSLISLAMQWHVCSQVGRGIWWECALKFRVKMEKLYSLVKYWDYVSLKLPILSLDIQKVK